MTRPIFANGLPEILTYVNVRRGQLIAAVTLSFIAILATLALPLGIGVLVDSAMRATSISLGLLAACLFVLFIIRGLAGFFTSYLLRTIGERVVTDLRARVFSHLIRMSTDYLANQNTGDLLSRLTSDVASVKAATTDALAALISQSTNLVGSAIIMGAMEWHLAAFIFVVMPLAGLISRHVGDRLQVLATRTQDTLAHASALAEEVIDGFIVTKAFTREDYESRRYTAASNQVFGNARYAAKSGSLLSSLIEFLFTGATVAIFWYGGIEMQHGRLTVGVLVAFLFYSQNIAQSVSSIAQTYGKFRSAAGAASRLADILKAPTENEQNAPMSTTGKWLRGAVVCSDVNLRIGSRMILKNISMTIGDGEHIAITGPTGAGKSTLLRVLLRFHEITSGHVIVGGIDIADMNCYELRQHVGYVPQEVRLFNGSIIDNIRYGKLGATDAEVIEAATAANVDQFVRRLPNGYCTEIGPRAARLSGGERQRIALARALLKEPEILLLDEPTSAVDATSEALIQDALCNCMCNRTVVFVSHRLAALGRFDRIVILSDGAIVQQGSPAELLEREGPYKWLVGSTVALAATPAARRSEELTFG